MYLSMVICIFISFPLSVVLKCQRHFVVKFSLSGSFRVRAGVKTSLVTDSENEIDGTVAARLRSRYGTVLRVP